MFFMCFGFDRLRRAFALVLGDRSRFWLLSFAFGLFFSCPWLAFGHLVGFLFPSSCYVLISLYFLWWWWGVDNALIKGEIERSWRPFPLC